MAKYHGDYVYLSPDDPLWVANPPIDEIFHIVCDPVDWVKNHIKGGATLLPTYTISFQPVSPQEQSDPRRLWVQGISGTNLLTLRVPTAGAQTYLYELMDSIDGEHAAPPKGEGVALKKHIEVHLRELVRAVLMDNPPDLETLVKSMYYGREILVTICNRDRAYAHMSLSKPIKRRDGSPMPLLPCLPEIEGLENRVMAAFFHLVAAAWPTVVDDVFNNGIPPSTTGDKPTLRWRRLVEGVDSQDLKPPATSLKAPYVKRAGPGTLPMTIIGHPVKPPLRRSGSQGPQLEDDESVCEMLVACYDAGEGNITYQEAYSKPYSSGGD